MITPLIVLCVCLASAYAVDVSTSLGDIRGNVLKSRLGEDFHAFRGIRYANAPVGDLRFKNPQPVNSWKPKVFDATDDGPMCPQYPFNTTDYSEDCLRLNVYSKDLSPTALKPVLIYIHPGGFYVMSGQSKIFAGPEHLMDRDIVLVTINYRLGTLGFLAAGTADAPGNAGLKDQVVALKWVRDHIRNFGGDPNSVTLLGYSAGSFSIGLHMVSPMSKGLFHKGITMSASPVSQLKYRTEQVELAKKQARLVNCPTSKVNDMVKCLRETPAEEFVKTQQAMFVLGWSPVLNWQPVIENNFGQERFIVSDPVKSFMTGQFEKIPLITGMTKDEFVQIGNDILKNASQTQQLNDNWNELAPICFLYEGHPQSNKISSALKKEFLKDKPLAVGQPFEPLGTIFSDALISFAVHRFAHLAARYVPVHYYQFSYKGRYSHFNYPGDKPYGTAHHDELIYLLRLSYLGAMFKKTDPEDTTVERLTRMWTQFAKTGDPNNPSDTYLKSLRWDPLDLDKENYLDIGDEMVMKKGLHLDRFKIWRELFPLEWDHKHCDKDYPETH